MEILDARNALTEARGIYCQSIHTHLMARLDLRRATGVLGRRPGMYARAAITLTTRDNALAVPFDVVNRIRGETVVYMARGDRIEVRPVVLGIRTGALQEISAGLAAADEIVVVGQHKLTDGSAVRNAAAAPATSAEDRP